LNRNSLLKILLDADSLNSISIANVTFEPSARSKWHSHPAEQILLVIDGVGYRQEIGQSKITLISAVITACIFRSQVHF